MSASPSGATQPRLTILGSSNAVPRPGRACSSYLVQIEETSIALDLGSGAFGNLRRHIDAEAIDAVVISHMHPDHFLDVIPMRYALRYGNRTHHRPPCLYLPPNGEALLRRLVALLSEDESDFLSVYDVRTYDPQRALGIGDIALRFAPAMHYIPAFAVRCDAAGRSVTYSADTAPTEHVVALARDTDAFLCEATLRPGEQEDGPRGHSSAREAGAMAQQARARRLLLTHYGAEATQTELEAEARRAYNGTIVIGDDNVSLTL